MSKTKNQTWKQLVDREAPLLLPAAHDALTAKLIERAGFKAYQVGGFALNGARHAFPDLDLTHYGEERDGVRQIIAASSLPVLVDADYGYGDVKKVTRSRRDRAERHRRCSAPGRSVSEGRRSQASRSGVPKDGSVR